jgi:hypothetical protein
MVVSQQITNVIEAHSIKKINNNKVCQRKKRQNKAWL